MKVAALISQAIVAALTFTAFVKLPEGSCTHAWVPFVFLACSVVTIVALIRPFRPLGRWFVIALNSVFLLLSVVAIAGVTLFPLTPEGLPIFGAVAAILVFALPYCFSVLAIYKQSVVARSSKLDACRLTSRSTRTPRRRRLRAVRSAPVSLVR